MKKSTTLAAVVPASIIEDAWQAVGASFERFCLTTGLATLADMLEEDATRVCGPRYGRADGRDGHRWGTTTGKVGFHGGKVEIDQPRVRMRTDLSRLYRTSTIFLFASIAFITASS